MSYLPLTSKLAATFLIGGVSLTHGATALFLGQEYQAQAGTNAGTIRGGDPASDAAFAGFLGTAQLTSAEILVAGDCATAPSGVYATWGSIAQNSTSINLGATTATVSIAGWGSSGLTGPSGNAVLGWAYNNTSALQSGAPRPGFASGAGSGYGINTNSGAGTDGIRNAIRFELSTPVSSFGIFGGDLETGASGSPLGFLYVSFTDGSSEIIDYTPDSSLFPDTVFSGTGNNDSETYGNETARFVGISDDSRFINEVVFVVGDDDLNDDGDTEQLSFIAPMTFTEVTIDGNCVNYIPTAVPEPTSTILGSLALVVGLFRRRRA